MMYLMKRRPLNNHKPQRRETVRTILAWISFLVILGGFVYFMNQPFFFVTDVRIEGQETISQTDLRENISEYLSSYWLHIIPRQNFLFVGKSKLNEYLIDKHPTVYDVDININVNEIDIILEEREAHSLWCIDEVQTSPFNERCYLADQHGYWYKESPYFSDNVFYKFYLDPKYYSIRIGGTFKNEKVFLGLSRFVQEVESDYNIDIKRIYLRGQGDAEIIVREYNGVVFNEKPAIFFNIEDSFERTYRNLGIVLNQDSFIESFNEHPQDLESIDVRFDDRVFYRFTD